MSGSLWIRHDGQTRFLEHLDGVPADEAPPGRWERFCDRVAERFAYADQAAIAGGLVAVLTVLLVVR